MDKSDIDKKWEVPLQYDQKYSIRKAYIIIQNTTRRMEMEIVDATEARFIGNNRQVMYRIRDTLFLITLGSEFKINLPVSKGFC